MEDKYQYLCDISYMVNVCMYKKRGKTEGIKQNIQLPGFRQTYTHLNIFSWHEK